MEINSRLSFLQILEIVKNLPGEQKIALSKELEKETVGAKLSELLTLFRTEELSMDEITKEVEHVRQELYSQQKAD